MAAESLPLAEYVWQDIRGFLKNAHRESWDLVFSLYTTVIGYFSQLSENVALLRSVHRALTKGGVLIIDSVNREKLKGFKPMEFHGPGERIRFAIQVSELSEPGLLQYEIERPGEPTRIVQTQTWFFGEEQLTGQLREAGFSQVASYGGLDRSFGIGCAKVTLQSRGGDRPGAA
jgi:SAM-dependent methyltransferase